MSDTTSILDLPTDPVTMKIQEPTPQPPMPSQGGGAGGVSLDQSTINQIVNGLQQAKLAGATQLVSRDIPMTTTALNTDPQIIPNYVPPPPPNQPDYISEVQNYSKYTRESDTNSLDDMYNEIQTPLLIGILYFLFQLPFVKKFFYNNMQFMFANDGNYNLNGYVLTSILFGMVFHMLMKTTKYFGTF